MTSAPFDAVADQYDEEFTDRRLGRMLRARVQSRLADAFASGSHVLELGCGTGEDAVWLAKRGVRVTGFDASDGMIARARAKADRTGTSDRVTLRRVDLEDLPDDLGLSEGSFDGAFSNFGVINCLSDPGELAGTVSRWVRPGGRLVLVVMGPLCPWEVLGYALRGRFRDAFRRAACPRTMTFRGGRSLPVWYHSASHVRRAVAPWFRHLDTVGIGVLLPPTDFSALVDRWPSVFESIAAADDRVAGTPPGAWFNDHHLTLFERR